MSKVMGNKAIVQTEVGGFGQPETDQNSNFDEFERAFPP